MVNVGLGPYPGMRVEDEQTWAGTLVEEEDTGGGVYRRERDGGDGGMDDAAAAADADWVGEGWEGRRSLTWQDRNEAAGDDGDPDRGQEVP